MKTIASATQLGAIRAGVCSVFLVQALGDSFTAVGELPITAMAPPGIMKWVPWSVYDRLVTPEGMLIFKAALCAALFMACIGYLSRASLIVALILEVIFQGLLRSFGHFNHDEMAGLIILGILAFSPSGDGFAVDRLGRGGNRRRESIVHGYPILLAQLTIAWVYCSAGLLKLRIAGLAYFSSDQLPVLAIKHSLDNLHDTAFTTAFLLPSLPRFLLSVGLIMTVSWEVFFPFGIWFRRVRPYYLLLGVGFHLSTMVLMNITFWNMMAMYLVFVDWPRLCDRFSDRPGLFGRLLSRVRSPFDVPEQFIGVRATAGDHVGGVLLWDGTCGFCARMVERLVRFAKAPVAAMPFQEVDDLPIEVSGWTNRQMHWVSGDGQVVGGSRALSSALRAGGRPVLAWLMELPPIRPFSWLGYRAVAGNRDNLGPLAGASCTLPD